MSTPFLTGSYITVEEFRAAPTALQTNNLVPGGNQATQDAELAGLIARASRWIDSVARQPLYATQGSQNETARINGSDALLHAKQDRVKSLDAFSWGHTWTSLNTMSAPFLTFLEESRIRVALSNTGASWQGGLSAMFQPTSGSVFVQWTFTAGWATTRLTNVQNIGDSVVVVDNPAGIIPGTQLRFSAGATQNTYTALSVSGHSVTLTSTLIEGWPAQAGVSEVPDDIKEACILATCHYIKERKGTGLVMQKVPTENKATKKEIGRELDQALLLAKRYERLAT